MVNKKKNNIILRENGIEKSAPHDHHVSVLCKVSKGSKIRNRYNQVPHLTQDTNRKVTNSQLDTTK